ncbi:MAG: hypothetical protein GY861_24485 [bacterium]|nr:hypothetical protein [bacterium]
MAPKALERKYQRELNKFGRAMISSIKEELLPVLKSGESEYVLDSITTALAAAFMRINKKFTGSVVLSFANLTANQVVNSVSLSNKERFDKSIKAATGVNLGGVITSENLNDFLELSVARNTDLITTLPDDYLKNINTIITNGVASGARYSTIEKQILGTKSASNTLKNNIARIARNEVQTINAQINVRRSNALGIKEGIFRTSKDRRVRKCHKELDGEKFLLSKGAWSKSCGKYIIPGITDIGCRCSYSPVIELE